MVHDRCALAASAVDHNIGALYHRRMGELYDRWMGDVSTHMGGHNTTY